MRLYMNKDGRAECFWAVSCSCISWKIGKWIQRGPHLSTALMCFRLDTNTNQKRFIYCVLEQIFSFVSKMAFPCGKKRQMHKIFNHHNLVCSHQPHHLSLNIQGGPPPGHALYLCNLVNMATPKVSLRSSPSVFAHRPLLLSHHQGFCVLCHLLYVLRNTEFMCTLLRLGDVTEQ